jgi:probable rRNA maturation factor
MKINIINQFDDKDYSNVIHLVTTKAANLLNLNNKEMNVILVSDEKIKELNNQYREKDYITDVLTFPDGYLNNLGDIFIALQRCELQANELGHSFDRELGFLTVHGLLHTIGYDHQNPEEETIMVEMQNNILNKAKLYR